MTARRQPATLRAPPALSVPSAPAAPAAAMSPTRLAALLPPLAALPLLWVGLQDPPTVQAPDRAPAADDDEPERFPDGVLARIGDQDVTLEAYQQHLFEVLGLGMLEDLIYTRLLDAEAARLGLTITRAELDEAWDRERRSMIARAGGDPRVMLDALADMGHTEDTYRRRYDFSSRPALLEAKLVLATRAVEEDAVTELFERRFGVGGVQVTLRHLFLSATRTRAELRQAGTPEADLTPVAIDAAMVAKAEELVGRAGDGADLEALCRAFSHDISVHQNGGLIPGYNYKHYGPEMAAAVRAAEVGALTGPVRTSAGLHLIRVEDRVVTTLDEVRAELVAELTAAEPSYMERGLLKQRLFREGDVRSPGLIGSRLVKGATGELDE